MAKKITLIGAEELPTSRDGSYYLYRFSMIDTSLIGKPEEKFFTTYHKIEVRITYEIKVNWLAIEENINFIKVCYEFSKRELIQKVKDGSIQDRQELIISTTNYPEKCPFQSDRIKYDIGASTVFEVGDKIMENESDIKKKKAVKSERTKTYRSAFNKYSSVSFIGEGGSGKVYKVQNEDNEFFALKCLDPQKINKQKARRFENELKFCYRSIDKNIVRVLDWGLYNENDKEYPFYIMPYYPQTLRILMDNKIEPEQIMKLLSQILDGVEAAHLKGVYHRDLKPENILYDSKSDNLVIADFGIAHFSEEELHKTVKTKKGERLASFKYAAPEQREKESIVDNRADIYALGAILYEMFTGLTFQGTGYKKIGNVFPNYEYLDILVDKMTRQSADDRYQSIDEIKNELIARENEFISRQKLNELNKTVIPTTETDDPIVNNPVRLISFDYNNDILFLRLNQTVTTKWEEVFKSITGYTAIGGKTPSEFNFSLGGATIPAKENQVQLLIDYFKTYLVKANTEYKHRVINELKQKENEVKELQRKKILEEEKRQRILKNTKI